MYIKIVIPNFFKKCDALLQFRFKSFSTHIYEGLMHCFNKLLIKH